MKSFNNEFENYKVEAQEKWGKTKEYKEYLQKCIQKKNGIIYLKK